MIIDQTSLDMAHKIYNSIKSTIFKFSWVYNVYDIFKYNKVIKQKNHINNDDDDDDVY